MEDKRAELRNKDREAEVLEERHQMELKARALAAPATALLGPCMLRAHQARRAGLPQVYKQKVKHLLYEHQNHVALLKAESELTFKLALESAAGREAELHREKRALRQQLAEQVLGQQSWRWVVIRGLKGLGAARLYPRCRKLPTRR